MTMGEGILITPFYPPYLKGKILKDAGVVFSCGEGDL